MESQNKQIIPYIYAENEVQANVIRLAQRYETMGADELFIYNYATDEASREEFLETARQIDKTIDIPFTIGIYVDRFEDIKKALYTGAKHVVVKEEITENWDAVKEGTDRFGNDKIVVELTCTDEFLTPSEIKKFQNMNIYAVLLKHVDVNERLCENLKHVDMPVIIRDSLKRNDLSELMEEKGLDVIREYLDRGFTGVEHPEYWLNASALGEMVRILCPELETSLHDKLYG